ncbi:MAG: hypothetical protein CMH70_05195 [Nitrosomonadaceae bacterium]|nr:hypothetical protein [Nitrosomonadaceae bacterium]|tara:strand:+ start:4443 stop:5210 length:768 start_codon:yes stop_codon:yes gene_type:complete
MTELPENINLGVRNLYNTGEYYFKIPSRSGDFEEEYWGSIKDPDGKERNLLDEFENNKNRFDYIAEYLKETSARNLLDVGCGLGALLASYKLKAINAELHGTELSSFAGKHASKYGEIFIGNLEDARYEDESFDAVTCHHVIEHVVNPEVFLSEIKRVLKKNGVLVLATPDFDSGCARRYGKNYRMLHDKTHISLFSSDSMHRFLRDYGFIIKKVEFPYFDTEYFNTENLLKILDGKKISPPFYGNYMTFFCEKS